MKFNKNLLASAVAASVVVVSGIQSASAEIELGTGLSVTGFVDMSYLYTDVDVDGISSDRVFGIDQVETDFLYSGSDGVSAQVDIEYSDGSALVEQAFITKQVNDSFSVKAGRFLSYSGWETEEPTGLYQYSAAGYGGLFYGGYQQGVSAYYDAGVVDVMVSAVNSAFDSTESDSTTVATEFGLAIEPMEGVTAKLFHIVDEDTTLTNVWASYAVNSLTFAAEYNVGEYKGGSFEILGVELTDIEEADGYLLMANYAADSFGFTVRYHGYSIDGADDNMVETTGLSLAPSYALGDNLLIVAEYRMDEYKPNGGDSVDVNSFAVEALFTF